MEAASTSTPAATDADRDFALRLGSMLMHVFQHTGAQAVVQALDGTGLSFVQMKALCTVGADPDKETSVKHVCESIGLSLPSASRAVEDLVQKDLATRVEDPEDRRVRRISLTPEGRRLVDQISSSRLNGLERFVSELSKTERAKLEAAVAAMLERDEVAAIYATSKEASK